MASTKTVVGKKAALVTIHHFARVFRSKAKVQPFRSVTLLSVGGVLGGLAGGTAGWLVGRGKSSE